MKTYSPGKFREGDVVMNKYDHKYRILGVSILRNEYVMVEIQDESFLAVMQLNCIEVIDRICWRVA